MQDRDHISHGMDEAVLRARQSTGQAEDVGIDTLNPYVLSSHHPDDMAGESADASIRGFSAGKAFLCSSSSQQEATLDKTLSAALMAD